MKNRNTFTLIMAISLILTNCLSFAQTAEELLPKAIQLEEVKGELEKAIEVYQTIVADFPNNKPVASKAQLHIGLCYEKLGNNQARKAYERVVRDYPDQTEMVNLAKAKLMQFASSTSEATMKAEQSFRMAADLFKQFKYESAVAEYEKVTKLAPKSQLAQEAQLWIGYSYFKQGKNDQALKSFNALVKEFPESTIIPLTELMIGQVQHATAKGPKKSTVVALDDKTILDTVTDIRYTRINTWAGKNDIIKSAIDITDISPNRKFILYENKVVPFDFTDSFTLFDTLSFYHNSRLSPDGKRVAFFTKNSISIIPVSPETGHPTGPAKKLFDKTILNGFDISWSPNGENILFSIQTEDEKFSIWEYSIKIRSLKQVTDPINHLCNNMFYSKNDSNLLYQERGINGYVMKLKAINGKSLTLLNSISGYEKKFILSPDNQWILYKKRGDKKMLYRLADKQQEELIAPEEVGDYVSWADDRSKVFFYRPSAEKKDIMKVASIFGASAFEIGAPISGDNIGWSRDSREIIVMEGTKEDERSLKIINLNNQESKTLDGIKNIGIRPSLSPDGSKILLGFSGQGKPADLSIIPISLKDFNTTGNPIVIFKGFTGYWETWSPDGNKIAVCDRGDIWICNTEGSTPVQLTKTPLRESFPSWSPDGNYISVLIQGTFQLQVLKSSNGEVITTFEKTGGSAWTPDGKELTIAFEDGQLHNVSIDSWKSRKIANWKEITHCTDLDDLEWSPDGKWLAINGYVNGPEYITPLYLLNPDDGIVSQVEMDVEETKGSIKWSPDSKWISYYSFDGTYKNRLESILWEADLTGFMTKMKPGTEKGYTTDFDFNTLAMPVIPADELPNGWYKIKNDNYKVGLDDTVFQNGKKSVSVESLEKDVIGFGGINQFCDAEDYSGKKIKMTGYIKSENVSQWAGMWFRINSKTDNRVLSFDNMNDRPIVGNTNWTKCEIIFDVPEDSVRFVYGVLISGPGKIWLDNVSFEIVNKPVSEISKDIISNPTSKKPVNLDFEE